VALSPGYHWNVPYYSKIHVVPRTVQIMHLHREKFGSGDEYGALEVQTTDGASVYVDISMLYRFYASPGDNHGGPFELITDIGTDRPAWINRIQTAAINELKKSLGHLSTSDFYNPELRDKEVAQAEERINSRLRRFGIEVDSVLLRRYTYVEQRIDEAIFQKNLQDQEERLNAAAKARAEAEAVLEKVAAEGDAKIKTQLVQGENQAKITRSEADLYEEN
jgi:regulator of protease activity HflC (stomatin/prohibitin superfamily)